MFRICFPPVECTSKVKILRYRTQSTTHHVRGYEAGNQRGNFPRSLAAMRNANWSNGLIKGGLEAIRDDYYFKCTNNPKLCQEKFRFEHVLKKHMVNDSKMVHFACLAHLSPRTKQLHRKKDVTIAS